jgi:hypothetical protein
MFIDVSRRQIAIERYADVWTQSKLTDAGVAVVVGDTALPANGPV